MPLYQKGFQTAMKNGVLAGYPLDSLKVVLKDGSFHPVDSDQLSVKINRYVNVPDSGRYRENGINEYGNALNWSNIVFTG